MKVKKLCIVGAGGFGREVLSSFKDSFVLAGKAIEDNVVFLDDNSNLKNRKVAGINVIQTPDFIPSNYDVVIAIGDSQIRERIVTMLPKETNYTTLIHPTAIILDQTKIGLGSIITAGCIITCNISIGKHSILNLHTTIGHDCQIGNFLTTAPGVHISGDCNFGNCINLGTNSSVKQGLKICDDVTIGMGGVAVKDILTKGTYIGNPLKKLEK